MESPGGLADCREPDRRSVYSYATAMNGLREQEDLRLRFDVLTKTRQPALCRYWTWWDRAANVRLFRLACEVAYSDRALRRRQVASIAKYSFSWIRGSRPPPS